MRLQPCADIDALIELKFKPGTWQTRGIPESGCRIRHDQFERIVGDGGTLGVNDLIYGLMDWLDVTDQPLLALPTLRLMLDQHYPHTGKDVARCVFAEPGGPTFVFHAADGIDLAGPIAAWQRRGWLIAVACAHEDEPRRMTVAAPGPISLRVAQSILNHSMMSFMDAPFDSFEALKATSGRTGSFYSWQAGQATVVDWEHGLGLTVRDGKLSIDDELVDPPHLNWLAPRQIAMQVAIAAGFVD